MGPGSGQRVSADLAEPVDLIWECSVGWGGGRERPPCPQSDGLGGWHGSFLPLVLLAGLRCWPEVPQSPRGAFLVGISLDCPGPAHLRLLAFHPKTLIPFLMCGLF